MTIKLVKSICKVVPSYKVFYIKHKNALTKDKYKLSKSKRSENVKGINTCKKDWYMANETEGNEKDKGDTLNKQFGAAIEM